jgi:alkylated DNA repair protein alkB family protein 8
MTIMDAGFGLSFVEDFISPDEETAILAEIPRPPWAKGQKERNSIFRFGEKRVYTNHFVSSVVPEALAKAAAQIHQRGFLPAVPRCVTVNQYYPGQIIKPHYDAPNCGPSILVLSLLAPATMRFYRDGFDTRAFELPPRSLSVMTGESRYLWMHAVDPVEAERYSIVFRA